MTADQARIMGHTVPELDMPGQVLVGDFDGAHRTTLLRHQAVTDTFNIIFVLRLS